MRLRSPARLFLPLAMVVAVAVAACTDTPPPASTSASFDSSAIQQDTTFDTSLAQILRGEERFRVFSTLLDSAGLLPALKRDGPYTVFAATNPGIGQLPDGLVKELLLPANRDRLRQVVGYHVHQGQLDKGDLRNRASISTLTGQALPVAVEGGRVLIGEQRVSEFAITATNGRLFAFDALAIPPVGGDSASAPRPGTYDTLGRGAGGAR